MSSLPLRTLRNLSIFEPVWRHRDELDLDDPHIRFQYLRICRDTERFDRSLPLLQPFPAGSPMLLSEQLVTLDKVGDRERLRSGLATAECLRDGAPVDAGSGPTLSCAVARAQASFGRLRDGLRSVHPYKDDLVSAGPAFSTHMFLLVRLGWYRAAYKLIGEVGDLEREPADEGAAEQQLRRLVSASRALTRIGDMEATLNCHRRARELSEQISGSTGVNYPWEWRWHAYALRSNSLWGRLEDLFAAAEETPLWTSAWNPTPGASVADSSPMRVEHALMVLARFNGSDPEPLREALRDLDAATAAYGDSSDLAQAKAALLHQLGDDQALLRHLRDHPYSIPSRSEYIRLLAERGMLTQARAAAEVLQREQPTHPETLQLRVTIDARSLRPCHGEHPPLDSTAELLEAFPEDAPALAITAEKLAESGHFADSELLFGHLTSDNPVFGLGWAGRIRAAAWSHDWGLVRRIEAEFDERTLLAEDEELSGSDHFSPYWFAIAQALTRASQMDFDTADDLLTEAASDWRHRIPPEFKTGSTDPLWAWTVERHLWRYRIHAAQSQCEDFLNQAPDNAYFLVKYGWVLIERHELTGAERAFRRALELRPESNGAWKGMIKTLRSQLRIAEAHACAERAKLVLRTDPDLWCEQASMYMATHDQEHARALLEETLRFAPNHAGALALFVTCLSRQRDHQRAIAEAELACARRPDSIEIWEARCMALLRRGWDKQALETMNLARETITAASSTDGVPGDVQHDLTIELLSAGIFAQCGAELSVCMEVVEGLKRHRRSPAAIGTAAGLLRHGLRLGEARKLVESYPGWEGEFDLLCEHAEIAAAYGPNWAPSPANPHAESEALDERFGYSQCEYDLARARHLNSYSVSVIRRQVHLWNARRRFDDSIMLLRRAKQRMGVHFVVEMLLAETNLMRGRPAEAIRICEDAMARFEEPRHRPIWLRITHLRSVRATGRIEAALRLAEELLEDYPISRRARLTLARSLEDLNRTSEGIDHLQQCLRELPSYPPVGESAALFCRLRGEYERGRELIMESLRYLDYTDTQEEALPRADSGLLAELVLIFVNARNFPEAERYLKMLLAREDVHSQSLGLVSAGWFAVYEGDPEAAEVKFKEAFATGLCTNEARFGMGQAYMLLADRTSDVDERRSLLQRARGIAQQNIDDSDFERSLILAGQTAYQLGNWEEAADCFRRSIAVHPVHGGHLELAVVLNHQGHLTEALAAAERGARWTPSDAKLLATMGLTRIRMVVEQRGDQELLQKGAIEIDRALTIARTDPTVISAVVYAASHTGLYQVSTARAYLMRALDEESNRSSKSSMAHLHLMLAELTLRHGRGAGQPLRWLRPSATHWAKKALKDTDDPRAVAISISDRRRRRTARIANRQFGDGSTSDAMRNKRLDELRWFRHASAGVGLALMVSGVVAAIFGVGLSTSALTAAVGLSLAVAGSVQHRLAKLRFGGFEMDVSPATELAGTLNIPSSPPLRAVIMPQTAVSQSETQWRFPEARRQILGPAVGLMITGHYSYRDANFPWKTR